MSDTHATPTQGGDTSNLAARVERARRELAAARRRASLSTALTMIVGVLAIGLLSAYFAYGYTQIAEVTKPEKLVEVAEALINQNLPEARKAVEAEVDKSSPVWAENLSRQAIQSLPGGREKLEDYVLGQIDTILDQGDVLSEDRFREVIRENRPALEKKLEELATNQDLADSSFEEIERMLDLRLGDDMQLQARTVLEALISANQKLGRLANPANLTEKEQLERRFMMIARRLQLERFEPGRVVPSTTMTSAPRPRRDRKVDTAEGTPSEPEAKASPEGAAEPDPAKAEEEKTPEADGPPAQAPSDAPKDEPKAEPSAASPAGSP